MAHHKPFSKHQWSHLQKHELDGWCSVRKSSCSLEDCLSDVRRRYHDLMMKYAGDVDEGSAVLELGGGMVCMAQALPAGKITYLDPLLDDYRRLYPGGLPKGEFITGMAEDVPLPDASFDVILAFRLISYVENPELVLHEVERLLKPGGVFLLSVEVWPEMLARLHYGMARVFPHWMLHKRLYCYSRQGLENSLKRHFHIQACQCLPQQGRISLKQEYFYVCRLSDHA